MVEYLKMTEVIIGVLLITVILIQQKNVSLNLASMGGGMWEITRRWPEKVLHNTTVILGTLFIGISILLFVAS